MTESQKPWLLRETPCGGIPILTKRGKMHALGSRHPPGPPPCCFCDTAGRKVPVPVGTSGSHCPGSTGALSSLPPGALQALSLPLLVCSLLFFHCRCQTDRVQPQHHSRASLITHSPQAGVCTVVFYYLLWVSFPDYLLQLITLFPWLLSKSLVSILSFHKL